MFAIKKTSFIILLNIVSICFVEAQNSYSLDFDGLADSVVIIDGSAMIASSDQMTLSGWVYPRNTNTGWPDFDAYFGFRNETDADFYLLQLNDYKVEGRLRSGSGVFTIESAENSISPATWHHLALTYDGNNIILYIDGVEVGSTVASGQIIDASVPLKIGSLDYLTWDFDLDGKADEVSLWNIALTQQQIQDHMYADLTGGQGLVGYWNFNEGSGNTANDASGNGNHGTIYSATWSTDVPFQGIYPGPVELVINEFMASNDTTIADTSGEFADWVEIYNPSDEAVDLAGMTFSNGDDASAIPTGFPNITTISAGGFIFVWFDKDPEEGPLHIDAKLSGSGESVMLFDTDGTTVIDSIVFGEQFTDVSMGRFPDSSDTWTLSVTPTPGASNVYTEVVLGCNDPDASNYNPNANVNDDSCVYPTILCALGDVYVSEAANSGDPEDYIEIYNAGNVECSLAGFQLDDSEDLNDFTFGNVILEPGAYWLGYEDSTDSFSSGLGSSGDIVVLADTAGNILTVTLEASVEVGGLQLSQSFDADGTGCYTMPTPGAVNDTCVTMNIVNAGTIPTQFTLYQNYPNPFNPVTTLRYEIPVNGFVNITVYDMLGRKVKTIINQTQNAGYRSVIWDAKNDFGKLVTAGIYLYQIQAGEYISTKKMVLLK